MATAVPESAASGTTVSLVTQTRVPPEHDAEFARWQEQVNDVITKWPGYLDHSVIPPKPPAQVDWVVVQRFESAEAARAWLQSDERLRLVEAIQPLLLGQDDIHIFADDAGPRQTAPVTVVISMRVRAGQEVAFQQWQQRIAAIEATFEGFSGYKLEPPVPGVQDDWVSIVRFDSDAHLDAWLNSEQRQQLLAEAAEFNEETHLRKVRSGFEQWFTGSQAAGSAPIPIWKMNMIVLMMLFPTVFLFGYFVGTPWLSNPRALGLPFWLVLFLGNIFSTVLLAKPFVPWAARRLDWWLNPKSPSPHVDRTGAALVVLIYGLCLLAASQLS
jgi:uncharacterized protein